MDVQFTVSEFLASCNQTLEYALGHVTVEGEVASFKINQGRWVFFDLKDEESSVNCFLPLFQLRAPLEDGMKVRVHAVPKVTKWGKFSLTVQQIMPVGEGSIKKSFELLKAKLEKEGLFDPATKRPLPEQPVNIGVISSTQAAGYADFIKIINERWGGLHIKVAHTGVQGLAAADQIIRAMRYFNERAEVQVIAIMRGGGSADDLAVFNDEALVRAIAASKIPVITGIGHEIDQSLADLAADFAASTPSNVAQILTHDRQAEITQIKQLLLSTKKYITERIKFVADQNHQAISDIKYQINQRLQKQQLDLEQTMQLLESFNPDQVLARGYAILTGQVKLGEIVKITTLNQTIQAEVKDVQKR